jgi:hypothetical protein
MTMSLNDDFSRTAYANNDNDGGNNSDVPTCYTLYDDAAEAKPARSLCFIQPSGAKRFFYYSYLIEGEYLPDESKIILTFTTKSIAITGSNLEPLFTGFMQQEVKETRVIEQRYLATVADDEIVVVGVEVTG